MHSGDLTVRKIVMRKTLPSFICVAAAIILSLDRARADESKPTHKAEPTEIHIYNVNELIHEIPNYGGQTAAEQAASSGTRRLSLTTAGLASGNICWPERATTKPSPPQERIDELVSLIEEMVAPESWHSAGGRQGAIKAINDSLVISQTEENHRAIQAILEGLRHDSGAGTMIQVDLQWLRLTPEQLVAMEALPAGATLDKNAPRPVSLDTLKDEDAVVCRARTLGFNGQTLTLKSGRIASVVKNVTPNIGTGVTPYDFQVDREQSGITLQITPRRSQDRHTIIVDVQSRVTEALPSPTPRTTVPMPTPTTNSADHGMADATLVATDNADRAPNVHLEQTFRTTVRLLEGTPVIVGGMTLEPGKQGSRQLYLVVKARILDTPDKAK